MNAYNVELSERLALYSSYLVPAGVIFLSLVSMFNDAFINPDMKALVLDLIFLLLGVLLLSGAYRVNAKFRRGIVADREFRYLLLEKFEPFLKELSRYQVSIDELAEKVDALSRRVAYLSKEKAAPAYAPPVHFAPNMTFLIRSLNMSIITLGAIIFLYIKLSPNSIYLILILIFLWWYLITDEYDLFSDISAYIFIIFPILVIPITSLILLAYFDLQTLHLFLFIALILYVVGYYTIATYYATGRIPFLEKPVETYRDGGSELKLRNGGATSPHEAEVQAVREILDTLLGERKPPRQRNGGEGESGAEYQRNGGHVTGAGDTITITLDRNALAEVIALYLTMQRVRRRPRLFDSTRQPLSQSFISALYEKLKKFR